MDGDIAKWIWNRLKAAFPRGKEIFDYDHCSKYVHKVAKLQYEQVFWDGAWLNFGEVEGVIWGLNRMKPFSKETEEWIRKLIDYLKDNAHRIDYAAFNRGQYPRGSGGIESANKFICSVRPCE